MVVGTANYKHIRDHQAEVDTRETKLGEWQQEKRERLERIRQINASTKRRMSQKSTLSTNSDGMRSGHSSRRGSAYAGDSETSTTIPAVTKDTGKAINESGSRGSIGSTNESVSPSHLTISVPPLSTATSANGRPSTGSIGSDLTNNDIQEIVGGGCKKNRLDTKSSYVCGNCCIQ